LPIGNIFPISRSGTSTRSVSDRQYLSDLPIGNICPIGDTLVIFPIVNICLIGDTFPIGNIFPIIPGHGARHELGVVWSF
jgi:hypothetical protein